ncbi:hypothetical protein NIES4106_55300 (plasmid) [Fischerella sp. NIES-4106]|nr:hypothetical protein NIES4106_55300 [Fischerella sp. NIES-4106]
MLRFGKQRLLMSEFQTAEAFFNTQQLGSYLSLSGLIGNSHEPFLEDCGVATPQCYPTIYGWFNSHVSMAVSHATIAGDPARA